MADLTKIQKGVPIPPARGPGVRKYPWYEMEVGDSFYTPVKRQSFSQQLAIHNNNRDGKHFIARSEGKGTRVWRDK